MSGDIYTVPKIPIGSCHRTELIVKKSRFITSVGHVGSVDEAKAFIDKITNEFSDARHNCYAFNATAPGSTAFCGCSDDGEPKGTAGHPMLNVVLHSGVGEICCVVTRYFGGILLGTGGLVKAYQDSVKGALETLDVQERLIPLKLSLIFDMRYIDKFLYLTSSYRLKIERQSYTDKAIFDILIAKSEKGDFINKLNEMTKGSLLVKEL